MKLCQTCGKDITRTQKRKFCGRCAVFNYLEYQKEYYPKNKERLLVKMREYRKKNKEKLDAKRKAKRRAEKIANNTNII